MSPSLSSPAWFRRHFNEDYLLLYSGRSLVQAEREVDFVIRQLRVGGDDRVLDLCCGFGRHLQAFQERGVPAVGVDLSASLLAVARSRVGSDLVCADMRALPFPGGAAGVGFSVLVNFFTSFGYFDDPEDNRGAAREMARVLRPGGRFSIDLMNADWAIRNLEARSERSVAPFAIREERSYDRRRRRIEKTIHLRDTRTGEKRRYFESVRVYSETEARSLLSDAGLDVEEVFGDFTGEAHGAASPRMIMTGRRRRE